MPNPMAGIITPLFNLTFFIFFMVLASDAKLQRTSRFFVT
jgi:hypothetical protein